MRNLPEGNLSDLTLSETTKINQEILVDLIIRMIVDSRCDEAGLACETIDFVDSAVLRQ